MEIVKYLSLGSGFVLMAYMVFNFVNSRIRISTPAAKRNGFKKQSAQSRDEANRILLIDEQLEKVKDIEQKGGGASELPFKIEELIDLAQLEKIQDNFSKALGVATITVDNSGTPVTKASEFTDFCIKYTRGSEKGLKRCYACDAGGGTLSAKTNKPAVYRCHAGLVDFGVPILIDGVQIGSILGGQVLTSPPDEKYFRKVAREIGVNPDEYIRALRKVPIISPERVQAAATVLYLLANTLSDLGYTRWKAFENATDLSSKSESLVENTIGNTRKIAEQINELRRVVEGQSSLVEQFSTTIEKMITEMDSVANVSQTKNESSHKLLEMTQSGEDAIKSTRAAVHDMVKNSEQIGNFMHVIGDINDKTHLLSINASIEAAHAGARGSGFAVVAGEIKNLAESSAKNTAEIVEFLEDNSKLAEGLTSTAKNTESSYMTIEREIKEVLKSLEEITLSTGEMSRGGQEVMSGIGSLQEITSSVFSSTMKIEEMINGINSSVNEMREITKDVSNVVSVLDTHH